MQRDVDRPVPIDDEPPARNRRAESLLLAFVLVVLTVAIGGANASPGDTYADDFESGFAGDTGNLSWTSDWTEVGESDGAGAGAIEVGTEPHCLSANCLIIGKNGSGGAGVSVERSADLSGHAGATLRFDAKVHVHDAGSGTVVLEISSDSGANWSHANTWDLSYDLADNEAHVYDLSNHLTSGFMIRFTLAGDADQSHLNVDDLEIAMSDWGDLRPPSGDWTAVAFADDLIGYVVGTWGDLILTTDAGANWATVDSKTGNDLNAVVSVGATDVWAVGELGTITHGSGASWALQVSGVGQALRGVDFADALTGWAVGNNGTILATTNGGTTWTPQTSGTTQRLNAVSFTDALTGWAVGNNGTILATTNGGTTWTPQTSGTTEDLNAVSFTNTTTGWAVGNNGTILATTNGGTTWTPQTSGTTEGLEDISFTPSGTGWVVGAAATILTTTDGGSSWTTDATASVSDFAGIDFPTDTAGWIVGGSSILSHPGEPVPGPANAPPVFDQDLADRSDPVGTLISIDAGATDPDVGDTLTYGATGLPTGLSIDTATGLITGALAPSSQGSHAVSITVTDDGPGTLSDLDTFTWTITAGTAAYLIADQGGAGGGDDLITAVDLADPDAASNEQNLGVGTGTTDIDALAMAPGSDLLYAAAGDQLGVINIATGVFTPRANPIGSGDGSAGTITLDNIQALAFDPFTGTLYGVHGRGFLMRDLLIQIDPATGLLVGGAFGGSDYVDIENQGTMYHAPAMSFDPGDRTLFIIHTSLVGGGRLGTLDPATGATTTLGVTDEFQGLAFDAGGALWAVTDASGAESFSELDPADGSILNTTTVDNGSDYRGLAISVPLTVNSAPTFGQDLGDRSDGETSVIALSAAASDPDAGDTLVYGATGLPAGLSIDSGSGAITGTISIGAVGSYAVEITVTDDGIPPEMATDTFTWTVTEINQAPVFDQDITDRIDAEGATVSFDATATDPNGGDTITYSATGLPDGITIDSGSGAVSGTLTYAAAGSHAVELTATDDGSPGLIDTDTFTWTVADTNRAPTFTGPGPQTIAELTPLSIPLSASDPDGDSVAFTDGATLPAWATLTDNGDGTASIDGTPGISSEGTTSVTITASDGSLPTDVMFDITVTNTNQPPTVTDPGDQVAAENAGFTMIVSASDPDGTVPSLDAGASLPAWATLVDNGDGTAEISGTPGFADAGTTTVVVTASDGALTGQATFDLVVSNTNVAPVLDGISAPTVDEGTLLALTATATDSDLPADTLTYSLVGVPPLGASITPAGDFTWTPLESHGPGDHSVTIRVTDVAGDFDEQTVIVAVDEVNTPPALSSVSDVVGTDGSPIEFTATATDPDLPTNTLTFSLDGEPVGASITSDGAFTWTPTEAQASATHVFDVIVSDDASPPATDRQSITATISAANEPPVIEPIDDQAIDEKVTMRVPVVATDVDNDDADLVFELTGVVPDGVTIDASGTVEWTPTEAQGPGVYPITVRATDPVGESGDDLFIVIVRDVNEAPFIDPITDQTVRVGDEWALTIQAGDPDGTVPTFGPLTPLPDWVSTTSGGVGSLTLSGSPDAEDVGVSQLTFEATDGTLSTQQSFAITVGLANRAPEIQDPGIVSAVEGNAFAIDIVTSDPDGTIPTISSTVLPPWVELTDDGDGTAGLSGTPPLGQVGDWTVVVSASDGELDTTRTVIVEVTAVPPQISEVGAVTAAEHEELVLVMQLVEPTSVDHSFALAEAPVGAVIDAETGRLEWTPGELDGDQRHVLAVELTDPAGATLDRHVVDVDVTEDHQPPTIRVTGTPTALAGESLVLGIEVEDPDVPLVPAVMSLGGAVPAGMSIGEDQSTITWAVPKDQTPGQIDVTVRAEDGSDPTLSDSTTVTITITDPSVAPKRSTLVESVLVAASAERDPDAVEPPSRALPLMLGVGLASVRHLGQPSALLLGLLAVVAVSGRIGLMPMFGRRATREGVVIWVDEETGHGFILPDDGGPNLFFDAAGLATAAPVGTRVRYLAVAGGRRDFAFGVEPEDAA